MLECRLLDLLALHTASETSLSPLRLHLALSYYKTHGFKTIVMAASFRNVGEIRELAG